MRRAVLLSAVVIGVQSMGMSVVGVAGAQLPPVDVPDLPVPEVPVPDVQVPDVPAVPVPAPSAPKLPAVPSVPSVPAPTLPSPPSSGSSPSLPGVGSVPGSGGGSSGAGAPSGGGGGGSGGGGGASGGRASGASGSTSAAPASSSPAGRARRSAGPGPGGEPSTREQAAKRKQRRRRVGETVRRLAGCLGELPLREIRVLVLRAGVGPGPALSRDRVGDRLDLATRRVARIERRGLRHLRAAARDGCGGGGGSTTLVETLLAAATGSGSLPAAPGSERAAGGSGPGDSKQTGSGVKAEFESSDEDNGGATPAVSVPPVGTDGSGGGVEGLSIAALLLGLMMLGYAVHRELRSGGPAPG